MPVIWPPRRDSEPPQLGLLTDRGLVLCEDGRRLRREPPELRVYASTETVRRLVEDGQGEMLTWDSQPVRWRRLRVEEEQWRDRRSDVVVLAPPFPDSSAEALRGLLRWRDWLARYGARPLGGAGATGMNLLRATLPYPVATMAGQPPPIEFVLGPRQLLPPWVHSDPTYRNVLHLDLAAAYPNELGQLPYQGALWRQLDRPQLDQLPERAERRPLLVQASVRIPELPFGPLPERPDAELMRSLRKTSIEHCELLAGRAVARYPTGCILDGVWLWAEVEEALNWGCELLQLRSCWQLQHAGGLPFRPWLDAVYRGRELPGFARTLAKSSANATWGSLVPSQGVRRLVGPHGARQLPPRKPRPGSWDAAELVTAGVRVRALRLMRELGERLLSFHTDGAWVLDGPVPDGWEVRYRARRLDLLDPQRWRYWRAGEASPRYAYAGATRSTAPQEFNLSWKGERE